jgi:hypothetical protein
MIEDRSTEIGAASNTGCTQTRVLEQVVKYEVR